MDSHPFGEVRVNGVSIKIWERVQEEETAYFVSPGAFFNPGGVTYAFDPLTKRDLVFLNLQLFTDEMFSEVGKYLSRKKQLENSEESVDFSTKIAMNPVYFVNFELTGSIPDVSREQYELNSDWLPVNQSSTLHTVEIRCKSMAVGVQIAEIIRTKPQWFLDNSRIFLATEVRFQDLLVRIGYMLQLELVR